MNRFINYGLWTAGAVVFTALCVIVYLMVTFDPNDYKTQIVQLVKDKKQRTLKLDGKITLTFFPSLGLNLGHASLSEFQSDKEFLALDSAHISLALIPLLSKQLVVDEIAIKSLQIVLIKSKKSPANYADLLSTEESNKADRSPITFDIASVLVENSQIRYLNKDTGAEYTLRDINLRTGRIANNTPTKIDFSGLIQSKNKPKLDLAIKLNTTLIFDIEPQWYQVKQLELQAEGAADDMTSLVIKASGNGSVNFTTQEFTAKELVATARGVNALNNFVVTLNAPSLNMTKEKFSSDNVSMNIKMDGATTVIAADFTLRDFSGGAQLFKSNALMEAQIKHLGQVYNVKIATPISGNLDQQQLNLSDLTLAVNASGDKIPNKSISSEMKGSLQLDGSRQSIQASLAGGLLQSQVKARVAVNRFTRPKIRFDLDVDRFDADLYFPPDTEKSPSPAPSKTVENTKEKTMEKPMGKPMDLTALKTLNLQGSLRFGTLKVANVKLAQLHVNVSALNGQLNINPLSAKLYQGAMQGNLNINATQAVPVFTLEQKLSGINVAPLLKDVADTEVLEGKGNVSYQLNARGDTVSALKNTLAGNLALDLMDGAIRGFNLQDRIREVQEWGRGGEAPAKNVNTQEKTEFNEFKASFKINNGVAHNEDLSVKSQLLRITGVGDINISNNTLAYVAQATLSKALDGQGGTIKIPVHLSGPFSDVKYRLDLGAMVSDIAKQKFEVKKEQLKSKSQEKLKNKLEELLNNPGKF